MSKSRAFKILLAPHISEKSAMSAESGNQMVFKVAKDANKLEIKEAVEQLFDVKVNDVRVLNQNGKRKRFGQMEGKRKDWKKAYVRLAEGQDIDVLNAAG